MKKLVILAALLAAQTAYAIPNDLVPIEHAQRVLHFPSSRNWSDTEGRILVCPFVVHASPTNRCPTDSWVPLETMAVSGYRIYGIQYTFAGNDGSRNLLVYFEKSPPGKTKQ